MKSALSKLVADNLVRTADALNRRQNDDSEVTEDDVTISIVYDDLAVSVRSLIEGESSYRRWLLL